MKTTLEFISDLKKKTSIDSDYAIAKQLGVTKNAISLYRTGKGFMSDETAMKVADLLEEDAAYVVACIHAEREKQPAVKAMWKHTAEVLYGLAAAWVIFAVLPVTTLPDYAGTVAIPAAQEGALYIMSNLPAYFWTGLAILAWTFRTPHRST